MNTYDIFWAPEGRCIATVKAASPETAKRQTPSPYKQYMGEVYVTDRKAPRSDP